MKRGKLFPAATKKHTTNIYIYTYVEEKLTSNNRKFPNPTTTTIRLHSTMQYPDREGDEDRQNCLVPYSNYYFYDDDDYYYKAEVY
jgi:hypothetical protein